MRHVNQNQKQFLHQKLGCNQKPNINYNICSNISIKPRIITNYQTISMCTELTAVDIKPNGL